MVVNPDCVPKDWDANSSKTQELGDENMGARRNVAPQIALGGHFSLTPLIYLSILGSGQFVWKNDEHGFEP